jgi:hypothetical protein
MKTASAGLITDLTGSDNHLAADLYWFAFASGTAYWTSGDAAISYAGNSYTPAIIRRGSLQNSVGTEVASLEITITPGTQTVAGLGLCAAARAGYFGDVQVLVLRSMSPTTYGGVANNVIPIMNGYTVDVEPGSSTVRVIVKSLLVKAELFLLPRRVIQPGCPFQVYDSDCGVTKASFTHARTAASGTTASLVKLNTSSTFAVPGSWVVITSGTYNGARALVRSVSGADLTLDYPLPGVLTVGDGIDVIRGCDKTRTTCDTVFSNLERNGGLPSAAYETSA